MENSCLGCSETLAQNETDLSRYFDNLRLPSSVIDKGSYKHYCILTSDLSTSVCASSDCSFVKVHCLFNYFAASQKCCAVVHTSAEVVLTCYVCSLRMLASHYTPSSTSLPFPRKSHLAYVPCTHRIALSSTHAAQPRGIAHTQTELIHTHTNSFNLSG